ncbi:Rho guanine nucleotide exchange factor scd1 [Fusarium mundagurra]|uniref:Rho guanine nucleotide exchange factor scd1 n=1 Tax=Fusarium mundagurra TaxID=1567541 RepID=A0A8H5YA06_9HYPO|nr:Rho guanine nucleotide exchange factor scd1 [Fusarium mundagurra]
MANGDAIAYNIAVFISTLFLLEFGADKFVDHTAIVARRTGIPDTVIALLTAGAEWEELVVVVASLAQGRPSLAVGNIIGSTGSHVEFDRSSRIYSLCLLVITTFVVPIIYFSQRIIWLVGGSVLIALFAVYLVSIGWAISRGSLTAPEDSDGDSSDNESDTSLIESAPSVRSPLLPSREEHEPEARNERDQRGDGTSEAGAFTNVSSRRRRRGLGYHIGLLVLGFLAICLSGYVLSHAAINVTDAIGISDVLFGIVILAIATTLPEKFVAVLSGNRGHVGILVANTVGSNVFLLSLCLGIVMVDTSGNFDGGYINVPELCVLWGSTLALTITVSSLPLPLNLALSSPKMSDPLSVAASIAGLISITVEAVKFLSPYVSAAKETPQVAAHVYSEVQSTQVILMGLQSLTKNLGSVKIQHAALIGVNQVVAILTDGVLLYSELHKELQSLRAKDGVDKIPLRGRLQWSFKSSMTLVLMILQSDSGQTAKEHQEQLSNNVKVLLDSNEALSRRLMNVEDALDDQTIISRRMSILSLSASPSQNTSQQSTAESPATSISTETSLSISKFDFEDDLESSRVYRRAVRETMDFSFRSSIARSHNWSVFSGLSLGDISIMSVIALPVHQGDISNFEHYDFGEEASVTPETPETMTDQPLLMQCLELKLKLLTKPGMQKYFDKTPFLVDDFFYIWAVLQEAMPLVILARALEPTLDLDIDSDEELTEKSRKELVLWFAQFCHDTLEIKTSDLITVQDLMGNNPYGFLRTISLLLNITQSLPVTGSLTNDWSLAKARVNAQPPELRSLLTKQRQLVRDLDELLQMNDQFEVYMKPTFEKFRQPANVQILFLIHLEANLLRPPVEHKCLDILPTSSGRISALFSFSEYFKNQPISTEAQREDISIAQSCISKIVTKLQVEI